MSERDPYRELAERLLVPTFTIDGRPQTAELVPGRVPDGLPLELPVPPGASVLGAVARRSEAGMASADVVLDAAGAAEDVEAFYRAELPGRGWTPAPVGPRMWGGFRPAGAGAASSYCRGPQGPWLSVSVLPRPTGIDVRVHIDLTNPGPCANPPHAFPAAAGVLPPLDAPTGVPVRMTGGTNSPTSSTTEATAEADAPVADLAAHFAAQFAVAGWDRAAGGAEGPLAWSTWRATREGTEWHGLLLVLEGPGERRRTLYARVASGPGGGGGWVSTRSTFSRSG